MNKRSLPTYSEIRILQKPVIVGQIFSYRTNHVSTKLTPVWILQQVILSLKFMLMKYVKVSWMPHYLKKYKINEYMFSKDGASAFG